MPNYTSSTFLVVVALLYCTSLACAFYESDGFIPSDDVKLRRHQKGYDGHIPTDEQPTPDEGKLRLDEKKARKNRQVLGLGLGRWGWNDEDHERSMKHKRQVDGHEEKEKANAEDLAERAVIVELMVDGVEEPERTILRKILDEAALNRHWKNLYEFAMFSLAKRARIEYQKKGLTLDQSDDSEDELGHLLES